MDEEFMRNYCADLHCGYCGQQCIPDNINLVKRAGNFSIFSIYCHSCKKQGSIIVIANKDKLPEAEVELTGAEIDKFSTSIGSDDALNMHTFLKDFGGDFSGLLSDEKSTG
jgi:hypothetical protein